MRIALIRRVSITSFDGVNKFIALLAEGLAKLGTSQSSSAYVMKVLRIGS
jgi:hypothetical protein